MECALEDKLKFTSSYCSEQPAFKLETSQISVNKWSITCNTWRLLKLFEIKIDFYIIYWYLTFFFSFVAIIYWYLKQQLFDLFDYCSNIISTIWKKTQLFDIMCVINISIISKPTIYYIIWYLFQSFKNPIFCFLNIVFGFCKPEIWCFVVNLEQFFALQ